MINIRDYQNADYPMIKEWWDESGEAAPNAGLMPIGSSFIAEIEGVPALAVTVYLTNTKEFAYVENFVGNPKTKGPKRKEAAQLLQSHLENFAKSYGYKRLFCMTYNDSLVNRYQELGYKPTLSGVTTFVKEL